MNQESIFITESLSASNPIIEQYVDYLLQDLQELGSSPEKAINIIEENRKKLPKTFTVLELCCGKGALLLNLAQSFSIIGTGIDLHPPFITLAKEYARKAEQKNKLRFHVMDIKNAVRSFRDFDLVATGYDTDALGDEAETLNKIKECVTPKGFILYETAGNSLESVQKTFNKSGLTLIDKVIYTKDEKIKINTFNTEQIRTRAEELIKKYPHHRQIFEDYVIDQEKESEELNNDLCWGIFLLAK